MPWASQGIRTILETIKLFHPASESTLTRLGFFEMKGDAGDKFCQFKNKKCETDGG